MNLNGSRLSRCLLKEKGRTKQIKSSKKELSHIIDYNHAGHSSVRFFCDIFKIEFVEMCKTAIPALDGQVPGSYTDIMGTGEMAIPASSTLNQFPDRIFPKSGKCTGLHHIFYPGTKTRVAPQLSHTT